MKQRVTLYLDSDTWKMVRIYCLHHGISASQFVENLLSLRMMDTDLPDQLADSTPETTPDKKMKRGVSSDKPRSDGE